jgi:DNA-binding response OmpR family regulator
MDSERSPAEERWLGQPHLAGTAKDILRVPRRDRRIIDGHVQQGHSGSLMTSRAKHVYEFGAFRLDATDRLLFRSDQPLALPPKVFDVLLLLITNSGHILGKDEMMKRLWPDTFVEEGTLAQYISLLRKALGESGSLDSAGN